MSAATTYINGLLYDARCMRCLPEATQFEVQTYILAYIQGSTTNPATLAYSARAFASLSWETLSQIKVYLLAVMAGFDPTSSNLIAGSKCFGCIPPGMLSDVQTYLLSQDPAGPGITDSSALAQAAKAFQSLDAHTLLQIQVFLLAEINSSSTDPNTLAELAKCMICFPYPVLVLSEIQALDYLEPIPADSPRVTEPPPDPPAPPPSTPPRGRGGGLPSCTDAIANLTPVITGNYDLGVLSTIDIAIHRTCCAGGFYQVYGSNVSDMSGAALVTSGAIPNRTANYTVSGVDVSSGGFSYYAVKTVCSGGLPVSPYSNILASNSYDPVVNDWSTRVQNNGGTNPAPRTKEAITTLIDTLQSAGIWAKMIAFNFFAPDSLIAAITPQLVGGGNDPWTNNNFVEADVSRYGLTGNGSTKYLGTGIVPHTVWTTSSAGMTIIVTTAASSNAWECDAQDAGSDTEVMCAINQLNVAYLGLPRGINAFVQQANSIPACFSLNRTAAAVFKCYYGNQSVAFAQFGATNVEDVTGRVFTSQPLPSGAKNNNGVLTAYSIKQTAFLAFHQGLTQAECQSLYNAVIAAKLVLLGGIEEPYQYDTFESYVNGAAVNGLANGTRWTSAYVSH